MGVCLASQILVTEIFTTDRFIESVERLRASYHLLSRFQEKMQVYLVIHDLLPTYSMYINRAPYSEEIETVNSKVVAVFSSRSAAEAKAEDYFFETLGLEDNGDSDSGYKWSAIEGGGDCNEFDQEVYVEERSVSRR